MPLYMYIKYKGFSNALDTSLKNTAGSLSNSFNSLRCLSPPHLVGKCTGLKLDEVMVNKTKVIF